MYHMRDIDAKDTAVINQYLQDARNGHMGEDEKPIAAENIDLSDMDAKHHPAIHKLFRKHEEMWSGKLGHITTISRRINLVEGTQPVKAHP